VIIFHVSNMEIQLPQSAMARFADACASSPFSQQTQVESFVPEKGWYHATCRVQSEQDCIGISILLVR
jgi:hypothetical protein